MKIAIVTTSYQPGNYLIETLNSVISQSGDFSLYYHVQDAGSSDGTLEILQSQAAQISSGNTAIQCRQLTFSYSSCPDRGMYDGINRGFEHILRHFDADIMLWINADDCLASGALSNLSQYFESNPDVDWLIGRTIHLDEHSAIILDNPPHNYRRVDLAEGLHDGGNLPFVTQEAAVWRKKLWDICGILDHSLKYGGDFEYWMRAARCGFELHSANISVGQHRKRAGQLSSIGCYSDEVRLSIINSGKQND